jgi:hypothetical protein
MSRSLLELNDGAIVTPAALHLSDGVLDLVELSGAALTTLLANPETIIVVSTMPDIPRAPETTGGAAAFGLVCSRL